MSPFISRVLVGVSAAGVGVAIGLSSSVGFSQSTCPHRQPEPEVRRLVPPTSLAEDHEILHERLAKALRAGGRTAEAAQALVDVLHPHFLKEDAIATPPLSLLNDLAAGRVEPWMKDALRMTDELKRDLPQMLEEHEQIRAALDVLATAAREEEKPEIVEIARLIRIHAETEEQVLYPAAILVGEHIRLKLQE